MRVEQRAASRTVSPVIAGDAGGTASYVAIVSDGSARWAERRGLRVAEGHEAAADTVLDRIDDAIDLAISELTLYAFSTENWGRPAGEVKALLGMLARRITRDTPRLNQRGVRVRFIGRRDRGGDELAAAMETCEQQTGHNDAITVYVAFDYGGRDEIIRAAGQYTGGGEQAFAKLLHGGEMHDPDLVIRTSGEQRLSNFLLWQSAYSEMVFRPELWPDFDRASLEACLQEYAARRRTFGGRAGATNGTAVHGLAGRPSRPIV